MLVTKADGSTEPFKEEKLVRSLTRAGAPSHVAERILKKILHEFGHGTPITTQVIYSNAFAHLRSEHTPMAARYSLKRALLEFGPSGFPFETYIAELFKKEGCHTAVDQIIKGRCVEHEVDVVRTQGSEVTYVEAKFHNTLGLRSDLKTVLYVQARIEDIGKGKGMVVTNTKFTDKAIQYAECRGLELLGWDYPQSATLEERIHKAGLYPVTALTSLSRREKMALLESRFVLCQSLADNSGVLGEVGVPERKVSSILAEAGALCVPGGDI